MAKCIHFFLVFLLSRRASLAIPTNITATRPFHVIVWFAAASNQSVQVYAGGPGGEAVRTQYAQFAEFKKSVGSAPALGHHVH